MNADLGVRVALHTNRLTRTFARAGVGLRALTAHRQTALVADATIAFDALQTLQIHTEFAAQIAFDHVFAFLDRMHDLGELRFSQILRADRTVDIRAFENFERIHGADA